VGTSTAPSTRFYFASFELDPHTGELWKSGQPVKLPPQPTKLLIFLTSRRGELVTREEIKESLWGADTFVDFEQGLNFCIKKIRFALGDNPDQPEFIQTLPRRGYRFIGSARTESPAVPPETKPPRRKTALPFGLVFLAAAIVTVALIFALGWNNLRDRWFGGAGAHQIKSLAVLPLRNLSQDPEQEYFSDGMTDELITDLAKVSGLRIISHTSVERYKDTKRQLPEIARELGVDAIVEGTILRSGDRVRITAQLIDAHTDQHVWAESYERDLRDVLGLQGEVAQQIANQIGIKLTAGEERRLAAKHEVDPAAHEAYLKGSFYWNRLTCTDFETALNYFQEAATKDPKFASAYSGIAESYFYLADWRCWPQATFAKVEPAALKAVELDPGYGEAYASLGELAFSHEWNWTKAGEEFSKALQLNPNNADILCAHAIYLVSTGRQESALAEMRKAQRLDPVSENTGVTYIYVLYLAHKYDEAIVQAKKALALFPDSRAVNYWLGQCYEKKEMPDQAIAAYLKTGAHLPEEVSRRRDAYQKHGLPGYWQEDRQFRQRSHRENDPVIEAMYYAHMGEKNKAVEQLDLGYQQHCDGLQFLNVEPVFDSLRDDPRFKRLLVRLRL